MSNPGDPQSLNRYSYALNNAVRYTDPTGHYAFEDGPDDPFFVNPGNSPTGQPMVIAEPCNLGGCQEATTAELVMVATFPIWVAGGGLAAEAAVLDAAVPAASATVGRIASWLGLGACADGDCTNEATELVQATRDISARLKPLPLEIANTFENGVYKAKVLTQSLTVYRAEGSTYGRWFGASLPDSAAVAEHLYSAATYGNDLAQVSTYRILAGTVVYEGTVAGGSGWQIFVENAWDGFIHLLSTQPLPQYGF